MVRKERGTMDEMDALIAQFLRFSAVGIPAFLIDYLLLMLLSQTFGMHPVLAGGISFTASVIFNYVASMHFVYEHRDDISRRREFVTFVILAVIGLGINCVIIWLGTILVGTEPMPVTVTKLIAGLVVMLWNFWSRRHWLDAGHRS